MIELGVAATWIAISIAGAKGLTIFARVTPSDFEVDPYPIVAESGLDRDEGYGSEARTHSPGAR